MALIENVICREYTGTGATPLEIEVGHEVKSVAIRSAGGAYLTTKQGCTGKVIKHTYTFDTGIVPSLLADSDIEMDGTKVKINTTDIAVNQSSSSYFLEAR